MSIVLIEGFETYATATSTNISTRLSNKYQTVSGTWTTATGRYSGLSVSNATGLAEMPISDTISEWYCGFGIRITTPTIRATANVIRFRQDTQDRIRLVIFMGSGSDPEVNTLYVVRGGGGGTDTIIGSSYIGLRREVWHFVEFGFKISYSVGWLEAKIDGNTVLKQTNIDTRRVSASDPTSNPNRAHPNLFAFGPNGNGGSSLSMDDIYLIAKDNIGANTFLGDVKISALTPDADGSTTNWTALGGGSHYTEVDDVTPDDNTSYVSSSTANQVDLYSYQTLSGVDYVKGLQVNTRSIRTSSTQSEFTKPVFRSSAPVQVDGKPVVSSTSYAYSFEVSENIPGTNNPWTVSEINASEFGIKYVTPSYIGGLGAQMLLNGTATVTYS